MSHIITWFGNLRTEIQPHVYETMVLSRVSNETLALILCTQVHKIFSQVCTDMKVSSASFAILSIFPLAEEPMTFDNIA